MYTQSLRCGATFLVTVKPLKVEILGKEQVLSAGKTYDVKCQSTGSKPPALITWWKSSKQLKGLKKNVSKCLDSSYSRGDARDKNVPRSNVPRPAAASRLIASWPSATAVREGIFPVT